MATVSLTKGMVAVIDDGDLPLVEKNEWYAHKRRHLYYAATNTTREVGGKTLRFTTSMHRVILGITDPRIFVDHKNGNTLDNRRENLRVCTRSQNKQNAAKLKTTSSQYKGVMRVKSAKTPWMAHLRVNKKLIVVGRFVSEIEAAAAYDVAAMKEYGEFARPNFPVSDK